VRSFKGIICGDISEIAVGTLITERPPAQNRAGRSDLAMVRPKRVAFRTRNSVGTRGLAFAAQWLAYALPYRRFVGVLTDANARLGGRCGSLLLHRSGLAPPTPCRSPGALRVPHAQPRSRVSVSQVRREFRPTPYVVSSTSLPDGCDNPRLPRRAA
jgi:hypothetical protein